MFKRETAALFGDLLREFRVRSGLSQSDLAEKARISPAAVSALERGIRRAPYQSTVSLLAKALDLSPEELSALAQARKSGRSVHTGGESIHNLRADRTSFVGRDADVADIVKLVDRSRLVTITGSGGVGKTRVAIEAAMQLLGRSWSETWFVDLAPLSDGELIASRIAYTIEPPISQNAGSVATLASALAKRHIFFILDNCEHLIADVAHVVDAILSHCPHVSILATSRERLNVAGEFVYRLPSLLLPQAIDLFLERAQASAPQLPSDSRTLGAVGDIVRRLDGMPLAIELTAAHVAVMGLETLRDRLHQEFSIPSGRRDLPARQQTVNATIRWSFDLLTALEQRVLREISIFAGGFTLEAAEAICAENSSVLQCLSSLVGKSLLNVDNADGVARYMLLESVRAFGLEGLYETQSHAGVARRHAAWFARRANEYRDVEMSLAVAKEILPDIDNVRSAIAWSLNASSQEERAYAGQIVAGFDRLWVWIGRPLEHRRLLEEAIACIDESAQPLLLSRLLTNFIVHAGRETVALEAVDRAVRLCETAGDIRALAHLHVILVGVLQMHGKLAEADRSAQHASDFLASAKLEDSIMNLAFLANRHELRMAQGRYDEAREDLAVAQAQALAHGEQFWVVCRCYSLQSSLEYASGNTHSALDFAQRMLESEFGENPYVAQIALERIATLRLHLGDVDGAVQPLLRWLQLRPIEEFPSRAPVEAIALYLAMRGRSADAARLLGSVRAVEQRVSFRRSRMREDAYNRLNSLLEDHLSPENRAAAETAGALMTSEQTLEAALAALYR